jgi:hypothetical protein
MSDRVGRSVVVAFLLMAASVVLAPAAMAQEELPDNQGPAFLVISLTDDFEFSNDDGPTGSPVIIVPIGVFAGGPVVGNTTFVTAGDVTLPVSESDLPEGVTFASLDGNEVTIIGTFQTTPEGEEPPPPEFHLITADPSTVSDDDVQEAAYNAMRHPGFSSLFDDGDGGALFPTTADVAEFIAGFPPLATGEGSPPFDASDEDTEAVAGVIFATDADSPGLNRFSLGGSETAPTVDAHGELFPHTEQLSALFAYEVETDEDGNTLFDMCTVVDIDIRPENDKNKINLKSKGKVKVAILSSEFFDPSDIDECTVEIGGVEAWKTKFKDKNGDGVDDLVAWFKIGDLVCAGVLDECTESLTLNAFLNDGTTCIEGEDVVDVHNHKSSHKCDCEDDDKDDDD